ncbi:MAG: bifunctional pyr operon transcriptional regulator/uracil phosphoribosyltransferase PyrR [Bacteroidetes bacterium]|nr:bifunctional pyr operon transcriptional regulator/uracil phosphoribosyltransferase PyrR [Bacteroidota bacterium]
MSTKILLEKQLFSITIERLTAQLIENHNDFKNTVLIGLQPRGVFLANRIYNELLKLQPNSKILCGHLDITFYRDDFRKRELLPQSTKLNFDIEDKNVILIDDVLYTGRTIRSGLDAMLDFGRPKKVELLVLVNRRFARELPIEPNYVGITIDSIESQRVKVELKESDKTDRVTLID